VSESLPPDGAGRYHPLGPSGLTAAAGGVRWLAMVFGLGGLAITRARKGIGPDLMLLLAFAVCHLGLLLLYALVHIEARYLVAVQFVPPLALAWLVLAWRNRHRR